MGFSWGLCGARMGFVRGSFASRFGKGEIHEAALGSCEVGVGLAGSWCGVLQLFLDYFENTLQQICKQLGPSWSSVGQSWSHYWQQLVNT